MKGTSVCEDEIIWSEKNRPSMLKLSDRGNPRLFMTSTSGNKGAWWHAEKWFTKAAWQKSNLSTTSRSPEFHASSNGGAGAYPCYHGAKVGSSHQFITGSTIQRETNIHAPTPPPVKLIYMSLDCGMKTEYRDRSYTGTGRTCRKEKAPAGIEPSSFLLYSIYFMN